MIGFDVAPVAPLMAALLSIPFNDRYPPLDLTPQVQKAGTLEALLAQLAGLAARQPRRHVALVLRPVRHGSTEARDYHRDRSTGVLLRDLCDALEAVPRQHGTHHFQVGTARRR